MDRTESLGLTLIGDTIGIGNATETSGILDISMLVDYQLANILLTSNQGTTGSLTVLINAEATELVPEPTALALAALGLVGLGLVALRKKYRRA